MRFQRCEWTWKNLKGWNPRRAAAARRAVEREKARVEALRDSVGLFPELQAEIQPDFETEDERKEMMEDREAWLTRLIRQERLEAWRRARAAYFALPLLRRAGVRKLWSRGKEPCGPYNFAEFVTRYSRPGASPWTYLRKMRMMRLWNHHGWPKPANFLEITSSFTTLGPVRHPRLYTQTLISIARHSGKSLRQVHAERQAKLKGMALQTELQA